MLVDAVPADSVAVILNAGPLSGQPGSDLRITVDLAANLLARASGIGLLSRVDTDTRAWIESLATLPVVLQHPHALVLLDLSAVALPDGGHRLAGLRAALILNTGGPDAAMERRIQHFLSTYTNSEDATLSREDRAGGPLFSLRDRRLPSWAVIQWGRFDDRYVVSIGEGAMAEVLETIVDRTHSLGADEWFARAFAGLDGTVASAGCYIRFDTLYHGADRVFAMKIDGVRSALNLDTTERGLWTMRYRDRAVELTGFLRRNGRNELAPIATARFPFGVSKKVVPDQATGYTVIKTPPRRLFHGLCNAYLASRSDEQQAKSRAYWRGVERTAGVVVDRDILPHLAAPIIIHNHPKHMLRLPFAWTALTRVAGDANVLRQNVDKLLEAAAATFFSNVVPKLRRHPDGIWSIDLGISGPALAVTDGWLILSFSPNAVRENIALLQETRSTPQTQEEKTVLRQAGR